MGIGVMGPAPISVRSTVLYPRTMLCTSTTVRRSCREATSSSCFVTFFQRDAVVSRSTARSAHIPRVHPAAAKMGERRRLPSTAPRNTNAAFGCQIRCFGGEERLADPRFAGEQVERAAGIRLGGGRFGLAQGSGPLGQLSKVLHLSE
jgi:hypothetical protein